MKKINEDEDILAEVTRITDEYSGSDRNKLLKDTAKQFGYDITDSEISEFYSERELTEGELSMVAGGTGAAAKPSLLFTGNI